MSQMKTDKRFIQANREAIYSLVLTLLFFGWWYFFAYVYPDSDPANYSYIFGFPAWFFLSCIVGPVVFCVLVGLMVKFLFRDIPLDAHLEESEEDEMKTGGKA